MELLLREAVITVMTMKMFMVMMMMMMITHENLQTLYEIKIPTADDTNC